jgi:integrase/recombinase XerD
MLNSEARAAVRAWLDVRGEREADWLFYGVRGEPLGVQAVQDAISGAAQACGIGHVTPHMLRHTFCHRVLSANYERLGDKALLTVAQMAGHARLDTTWKYVVLSDEELLSVVEEL